MYLNDLEEELFIKGSQGVEIGAMKLFLLMYKLIEYCSRWKLSVNRDKTKVVVFRKGGRLPDNLSFYYYFRWFLFIGM